MYKVIGTSKNRTMRVYWALEEMGLDYEMVLIPPRSEEVLALNPSGKVPCLIADGEAIIDSVAKMDPVGYASGLGVTAQSSNPALLRTFFHCSTPMSG